MIYLDIIRVDHTYIDMHMIYLDVTRLNRLPTQVCIQMSHVTHACVSTHVWMRLVKHVKVTRITLQRSATHCNALRRTATHCNTLQHPATHYPLILQSNATLRRDTLQHTATPCNTLQHPATRITSLDSWMCITGRSIHVDARVL